MALPNATRKSPSLQSFNCNRKLLSSFVALVGLPFHIFTLSSHTKVLDWVWEWKTKGRQRVTTNVVCTSSYSNLVSYIWCKISFFEHSQFLDFLKRLFILFMGQPRPLFVYFRSFQAQILQKNCRRQRDSNSDRRSRRQTRWPLDHHHCPSSFQCWTSESGMKSCRHLGFSPMALFLALRGIKLHIKLKFPWN